MVIPWKNVLNKNLNSFHLRTNYLLIGLNFSMSSFIIDRVLVIS